MALLVIDEPQVGPTVCTPFCTFSTEVSVSLASASSTLCVSRLLRVRAKAC